MRAALILLVLVCESAVAQVERVYAAGPPASLLVFALGLALTSGALTLLHAATTRPTRAVEVPVLVMASAAATVVRFVLLRSWVCRVRTIPRPWKGDIVGNAGTHRSAGPTTKRAATPSSPRLAA